MIKNVVIIIDPWKRDLGARILFFLSAKYWMFKKICNLVNSVYNIDTVIIASYDDNEVDKLYLKWNPSCTMFWMTKEEDIEQILLENKVEKIFMCGSAWDLCVRNRPLGYVSLKKIINKHNLSTKILVKKDCVVDMQHKNFIPEKNPEWKETKEDSIFEYCP